MDTTHSFTVLSKLNEQRSQGLFCDVTIVVEDVKFRAHKNILAACSGYFRSALTTSETWSSCQVLELVDLKSEVFAGILNFIYCSKVTSAGAEDTRGLIAAGKKLGIPFLESLLAEERPDVRAKSPDLYAGALVCEKTKKEETDTAREPRITNAFSITEACPGNNPFTPLVQTQKERVSPDVRQLPTSCPTISCLGGGNEMTHALSEHSYAVTTSTDSGQGENRSAYKPIVSQSKLFIYKNSGPLKKRNRLRGILSKPILPMPAEMQTDQPNIVNCAVSADIAPTSGTEMTPPPLFSEAEGDSRTKGASAVSTSSTAELSPPHLSPHPEDYISIYSCEHCPEIFSNKALFAIHSELHRKRFVSHLFCRFCQRKFIHLKRLRKHEQICPKALRNQLNPDDESVSGEEIDQFSDDKSDVMAAEDAQLPPEDRSGPCTPEFAHLDQPGPKEDKAVKPVSSQRRYNCSMCKRVYVTLSSLKRHENVHSWQRAYPCHYCNKVFALAEYRTKHEIWHTGERRYQCIFCLETFMTYYILKNHQKSFHGIDPSLAVKKKSANGGLKASVYPIKLYRLLPMKFRKRQYKTYSHTYSDKVERGDSSSPKSNSLVPTFDDTALISHPDTASFPLTFMATTKLVSPVTPRICINKPSNKNQMMNSELETCGSKEKEAGTPHATDCDNRFSFRGGSESFADCEEDHSKIVRSAQASQNLPFLNSLNAVKKLGELSASAKRVEDMTKEILLTSAENFESNKASEAKTETYIAKPACQGSSVDSDAMPLCQITVKIGNEAIIRRKIKGSKLFPRKKKKIRELTEDHSSSRYSPNMTNSESPRLRLRPEVVASKESEKYDKECDKADQLWRPYYSYKVKKKKKLRDKHKTTLFHQYTNFQMGEAPLDRSSFLTEESNSVGLKHSLSRNCSPRAAFNCDICDSSFITESGLKAHVIGSHPCFCRTCGKQGPPGEAPNGGDYICNSCMENGSCFSDTARSPNPEKKFRCSFCPQRFLYLATKRSHEKKHKEPNEESDKYFSHEENTTENIKTEENSSQITTYIKQEGEHFPIKRSIPKIEDTNYLISQTPNQEIPYSNSKSPMLCSNDSKNFLASSNVKQKTAKKRINLQRTMHLISKQQICDGDSESNETDLFEPRSNHSDQETSGKLFSRKMSEPNGSHNFIPKPETWVCKEEPFF